MISKEIFCSIIENIRLQVYSDKKSGDVLQEAFGLNESVVFDNEKLFKSILLLLRIYFPVDKNGFCMIEYYCFVINFGKESPEMEYVSPEELYNALIQNK